MDKVFLEIFNTALTGGWIVLIVLLLRLALKKAPRAYSCLLWGIVGLRLVWPFSVESALSLIPSPEVIPQSQLYDKTPQVQTGIPSLNTAINPVFTETFQTTGTTSFNPLQWAMWIAGWVWVIGMATMVIYSLASYLRLRRQVCTAVRQEGNVYLCDDVTSPFILGIFRPKIYLPSDMPQEQMACVLAHEQAHLKRKDHWIKPLGFLLLTVYWFHPLLWVAYILLCRDIEFACDEKVIANMDAEEKAHYSETLLACSISHKHIAACPLAFGETGVKGRIQSVLKYKKPAFWLSLVALIVCAAVAVSFLTDPNDKPITPENMEGKVYVYEKEGAGGVFSIVIGKGNLFQYYEGYYSSHIGFGRWEMKDGRLYLHDGAFENTRTFVFDVQNDCLFFCAAESDKFTYVDVSDGEMFHATELIMPEQSGELNVMWVQVLQYEKDYLYVRDGDGMCWKVLAEDVDADDTILGHCWVSYYGEPAKINEQLSDDLHVQYQVTAQRCWTRLETVPGIEKGRIGALYDYCLYDIDQDGITEICVLSAGYTSGRSTFVFSVWENGVCEHEKWVYETDHSYGAVFVQTENGLCAVNSVGNYFYFVYANGTIRVYSEGWMH